ncbi:hypothetical protein FQN57_006896 [Myotisia sp. PD_48]|nr:hypothetical protein FQN57_006896 [Myotisia sp. PD_48]
MADFPGTKPVFTMQESGGPSIQSVKIDPPITIGSGTRGSRLMVTPMIGGIVRSESGTPIPVNGEFVGSGNDYIRMDPDGKHLRLDAHGTIKTDDDAFLYVHYTGVVNLTPELNLILSGQSESTTTPFGDSFIHLTFETGDPKYVTLEQGVFVAAGHFIYEKGENPIVEYKVSQVCKG